MHLFRLFDYNGPARLSLNTSEIFSYSFPVWLLGTMAHSGRMTMCSGDPDTARPSVAALSCGVVLVTCRGGPHYPWSPTGAGLMYLVTCRGGPHTSCCVPHSVWWPIDLASKPSSIGLIYAYQAKPPVPYNHCVDNPISCLLTVG